MRTWQSGPTQADWTSQAACDGLPTDESFPERGDTYAYALRICQACPVTRACLKAAMREEAGQGVRHGIRGGLTGRARAQLARDIAA